MKSNQELIKLTNKYVAKNYGRYPIGLVRGKGTAVWDASGKKYIDFVAGLAVNNLGHCPPTVVNAIRKQAGKLLHVSNLYHIEPQSQLAAELTRLTFANKFFFCNSGTEANEAAIKLARRWFYDNGQPKRFEIITMNNSFHGRTMASLSATAQKKIHAGFKPLLPGFKYVPFNDTNELPSTDVNKIMVFTLPNYVKSVQIYGQVKNPGVYGFEEGMNVLDLMKISGGLFHKTFYKTIYAPRADIIRRDFKSNYPKVIPINLEELKQGNQTQNIELHNWDIVFVRKNKNFTLPKQVEITGEVNIPGAYPLISDNETLQSLISRAGNLTSKALKNGISIYRDKKYFEVFFTFFKNFLLAIISISVLPTVIANGLPPKVDP